MYTHTVTDADLGAHAEELMAAASEYQLTHLHEKCEMYLCWKVQVSVSDRTLEAFTNFVRTDRTLLAQHPIAPRDIGPAPGARAQGDVLRVHLHPRQAHAPRRQLRQHAAAAPARALPRLRDPPSRAHAVHRRRGAAARAGGGRRGSEEEEDRKLNVLCFTVKPAPWVQCHRYGGIK
jgi:hypothetical protein